MNKLFSTILGVSSVLIMVFMLATPVLAHTGFNPEAGKVTDTGLICDNGKGYKLHSHNIKSDGTDEITVESPEACVPVFGLKMDGGVAKETGFDTPAIAYATFLEYFKIAYGIILSLAVIYFVWGGIKYLTSGGDPEKAGTAKRNVLYGAIGIAVIIGVNVVIGFIGRLIGVDVSSGIIPFT